MRSFLKFRRRAHPGFALVVSLVLAVMIVLLAVALLGLSSVSLRTASAEALRAEARSNARLALMLALGELQRATGPDQRVTAPAAVRDDGLARPHLTGVWNSWKWDGQGSVPDFSARKTDDFLRWLVSSTDPAAVTAIDAPRTPAPGKTARLVAAGGPVDRVDAEIVPAGDHGGYAWAVFDESAKLPLSTPAPEPPDGMSGIIDHLTAAPRPGYAAVTERAWQPLEDLGADRAKLVTTGTSAFALEAAADRRFHDVTSATSGLLVDVAKGGFAQDLSRLFDAAALPADFAGRFLYSDTAVPLAPVPGRFNGANPFPSPDPSWRLLHSHYRMYDRLGGPAARPVLDTTSTARPRAGSRGAAVQNHPFYHSQQIAPVIAKAQFVFSISFGWHGTLPSFTSANNSSLPPAQRDQYITWLVVDPVITLWNPYDVHLRFTGGRIDLYRVPLAFRLYKNGRLVNSEYTHLANTFVNDGDFSGRSNTFYRLNLLPEVGKEELLLAPGEHVVLTAHNHVRHYRHQFQLQGLDLRPGFHPPAGNDSSKWVGGASTMNLCVSPAGQSSGTDYGRQVRSIAVKPGDEIQVEVQPQVAKVDKPTETGGREISGFLKYYVGDQANPTLIGGIELDYRGKEAEFLPGYDRNDLPSFVVRNDIPPGVKADDDPPNAAAVVVRFKEPFLISSFQLKTERNSKFPSRGWLQNSPVNLYSSSGIDQLQPWSSHQYEFQWEAMLDWPPASPTIEIATVGNRGYGGSGIYAQTGVEFATHSSIPFSPALSLPQLRHAPLNTGGQLPLTSQVIANSFAPALLPADAVTSGGGALPVLIDHSFLANARLFDSFYFSGLATPAGPVAEQLRTVPTELQRFFEERLPLRNPRFHPHAGGSSTGEIIDAVTGKDGHRRSAAHLLIDSPFNVNSTRVDVWEAILASTFGAEVPTTGAGSQRHEKRVPVTRHLPAAGGAVEDAAAPPEKDLAKWNGHRALEPQQVRRLAEEIVKEVRSRGPFQSVSEFVNRQPGNGSAALSGALQAAIDRSGINDPVLDPLQVSAGDVLLPNPAAATGNTADGAPGVLTQADLLTPLAPWITVRGDTFRIRAYGEATTADGQIARAWCEAVVQRLPEYVDGSADAAWAAPATPVNLQFGRTYQLVGFRWLSPQEV